MKWIRSYLENRTQCVQIETKVSAPVLCGPFGAPQGSVLAGVLTNINSNDFPACHVSPAAESVLFVDDDSDHVQANNEQNLQYILQSEVNNSVNWLHDNRLCTAPDKSKILVPGTSRLKQTRLKNEIKINIDGNLVTECQSEKVLGVILNNEMSFKHHLYGDVENEGLIPQLSKRVGIIYKLSKQVSSDKLRCFIDGIFYSKINYCLSVYGNVFGLEAYKDKSTKYMNFTKKDNNKLQVLQNRVLIGDP